MTTAHRGEPYPTAEEAVAQAEAAPNTPQTADPAFRLAFADTEFLRREEMRAVRLALEISKPEILQDEAGIGSTVALFGSSRVASPEMAERVAASPEHAARAARQVRWYEEARRFARLMTEGSQREGRCDFAIVTGGGPGIMEAGNRGAAEAAGPSIGLSIVLPNEQAPNRWITPSLSFQFHYFGIRKMQFLMRARACAFFPGGFGTLDELFETLTLVQTGKIKRMPLLLFFREWWEKLVRWDMLVEDGMISPGDVELITWVETAEEGAEAIRRFYRTDTT
ncbi:LOG family protein [Elioraea rosea]|uniref:LOG family protein n=1 Tax=Elioraea rosea TaxID=2492390 RepID=UPI00118338E0|nr:LOG family protein [Elioraea rosea]